MLNVMLRMMGRNPDLRQSLAHHDENVEVLLTRVQVSTLQPVQVATGKVLVLYNASDTNSCLVGLGDTLASQKIPPHRFVVLYPIDDVFVIGDEGDVTIDVYTGTEITSEDTGT